MNKAVQFLTTYFDNSDKRQKNQNILEKLLQTKTNAKKILTFHYGQLNA